MSESGYEVRQVRPHHGFARLVLERSTGRILGGAGHNQHRAYVFPLNTPRGLCVVQEYAFDHPFHNGVFVGQAEIFLNGKVSNYWAPGPGLAPSAEPCLPAHRRTTLQRGTPN